jgi:hypothetical protein
MPECYKQDKPRVQLVGRQSPGSKEAEEVTALEAVIRQRLEKTQQIEKT